MHLGLSKDPFDAGQTNLKQPLGSVPILTVEENVTPEKRVMLRIVGELDRDTCNGALQEAGLFTDDEEPIMYNRVIFDTITKSDQFKLTLIWEITF